MDWQPISTLRRGKGEEGHAYIPGEYVLVFFSGREPPHNIRFGWIPTKDQDWQFEPSFSDEGDIEPTHWMPLPLPPQAS